MEFFTFAHVKWDEQFIHENITIAKMDRFCETITLLQENGEVGEIGTVWGEFNVQRQKIRGGVRFALLNCPNALAWTITTGYPPVPEAVVIHGTINRITHDEDFIESIDEFLDHWRVGLEAARATAVLAPAKS